MVYTTTNQWVSGLCSSFGILVISSYSEIRTKDKAQKPSDPEKKKSCCRRSAPRLYDEQQPRLRVIAVIVVVVVVVVDWLVSQFRDIVDQAGVQFGHPEETERPQLEAVTNDW
jgi:hypothetical protein